MENLEKAFAWVSENSTPISKRESDELSKEHIRAFLKENNINFKSQKIFNNCINYISKAKLKFDFYLPKLNMCIEYDGEQHFEEKFYTFKSGGLKRIQMNDNIKNEYCKNNNIKLLRISYNEFKDIKEILKENICNE